MKYKGANIADSPLRKAGFNDLTQLIRTSQQIAKLQNAYETCNKLGDILDQTNKTVDNIEAANKTGKKNKEQASMLNLLIQQSTTKRDLQNRTITPLSSKLNKFSLPLSQKTANRSIDSARSRQNCQININTLATPRSGMKTTTDPKISAMRQRLSMKRKV